MVKFLEWFWIHLRWRLYKASMRLFLGKPCGEWDLMINNIAAVSGKPELAAYISDIIPLSEAKVIRFDYPSDYPARFIRTKVLAQRHAYMLKDVAMSVGTGAMWIPDKWAFVESLGGLGPFYSWGGCVDILRKPQALLDDDYIVPCANQPYFHWLLNAMGQVLLAEKLAKGKIKVAVSPRAHRYVRDGLRFFGFSDDRLLVTDRAIRVSHSILVPRNGELGLVREEDIAILREKIFQYVKIPATRMRRIYISRRLEQHRAIVNEDAVEKLVRQFGFDVCYFEKMSFADQMQTVAEADVVMGIHGAGLSNIIAGQEGLKVIELFRPDWFVPCFVQLAFQLKFNYRYLVLARDGEQIVAPLPEIEKLLAKGLLS